MPDNTTVAGGTVLDTGITDGNVQQGASPRRNFAEHTRRREAFRNGVKQVLAASLDPTAPDATAQAMEILAKIDSTSVDGARYMLWRKLRPQRGRTKMPPSFLRGTHVA